MTNPTKVETQPLSPEAWNGIASARVTPEPKEKNCPDETPEPEIEKAPIKRLRAKTCASLGDEPSSKERVLMLMHVRVRQFVC